MRDQCRTAGGTAVATIRTVRTRAQTLLSTGIKVGQMDALDEKSRP